MTKPSLRLFILLLIAVPALLIACGPSAAPGAGQPGAAAEPDGAIPFIGEAPASNSTAATSGAESLEVEAGSTELDDHGIPVGYTAEGRPYRGSIDAPIVMEAFSDFQCPYCSRFTNDTLPALLESQVANGEVVLIFYDFPLNAIHPQAAIAANAARCAGEDGAAAYWAMHDRLFADIGEWSNNDANTVFTRYAEELEIAGDAFTACLEEERHAAAVEADLALGRSRGVGSTPSFFLNDQPVIGAYPLDYFNQAIAAVAAGDAVAVEQETPPQGPSVKPTPATITMDDVVAEMGDADAAVTIIEYTDYQCPYCARHSVETLPRLITEMVESGRVRYVVKDFPLDSIHPEARDAAVAARCAGEQDAYWSMHDALFISQREWSGLGAGANEVFAGLAAELSLDAGEFAACMDSGRYDDVVQANQEEGMSLGVNGTPAFFINGFPVSGAQPYELFEYAVGLAEEGTLADAYVSDTQTQPTPAPPAPVDLDTSDSPGLGDPDAPIVMIEFTDYQCPFCRRHFMETFPQIKAEYIDKGLVRYVFMEFPLTSIHPQAQLASEAALCANDQGAYAAMHDVLFDRQQEWSGREDAGEMFKTFAGEIGLESAEFAACLDGRTYEARVLADLETGLTAGVDGTPAFFLNGNFISGAQPYELFQEAIESLLPDGS